MAPKETAYYDLLGVPPSATPAEIRKAFRLLALRHHPDRAGDSPEATAFFQRLRAVHDVLLDPDRRAEYDAEGDVGTLHGGDPALDPDAAAAFFARAGPRLSEDDIARYEAEYRDGQDERDDLLDFFGRFRGDVRHVLDYIPYSDESDLVRFVDFWDGKIDTDEMETTPKYKSSRKALLKRGKGKERDLSAPADNVGPPDDAKDGKPARGVAKKAKKSGAADADLVSQILARRQKGREEFDRWADGLAERAEMRAKEKSKKRKSPAKAGDAHRKKARATEKKISS